MRLRWHFFGAATRKPGLLVAPSGWRMRSKSEESFKATRRSMTPRPSSGAPAKSPYVVRARSSSGGDRQRRVSVRPSHAAQRSRSRSPRRRQRSPSRQRSPRRHSPAVARKRRHEEVAEVGDGRERKAGEDSREASPVRNVRRRLRAKTSDASSLPSDVGDVGADDARIVKSPSRRRPRAVRKKSVYNGWGDGIMICTECHETIREDERMFKYCTMHWKCGEKREAALTYLRKRPKLMQAFKDMSPERAALTIRNDVVADAGGRRNYSLAFV